MLTLMNSLHAIAAERGDGLRPELLRPLSDEQARPAPADEITIVETQNLELLIESLRLVANR